ncbi:MAG: HlyD family efflux transporter periplasmic adaptor subunit [Hyphomicrobiaceae bacterium]|nr:HlyD family efflux transporter periplasmic adaptor subunit [Hyphomicrobiaceae bacterium]
MTAAGRAGGPSSTQAPNRVERTPSSVVSSDAVVSVNAAVLLAAESRVREATDETEVVHLIANETRKLLTARQVFVFRTASSNDIRVVGISSLAEVERGSACIRWIEAVARQLLAAHSSDASLPLDLADYAQFDGVASAEYPFAHAIWQPMRLTSGALFGAVLVTREMNWSMQDGNVLAREARAFSETWRALLAEKHLQPRHRIERRQRVIMATFAILALLFPVPMSVLAPVEIVASQPQRVNAPLDGVIASVLVEPNQPVKEGQAILVFEQTTLSNKLQLAERDVLVARARLDRVNQAAFQDDKARHEIALALAEYELKQGERDYASDLLERAQIVAERSGLLVYADKDRLLGQPVKTGERLMQIIDPNRVEARVELAIADAIVIEKEVNARLFLDAKPLSSLLGRVVSEGFMAEPNATQQLVYPLRIALEPTDDRPRIGSRGIAQLNGRRVPLFYYLLRRPIAAARQHLGL